MQGTMSIAITGSDFSVNANRSKLKGPLKLPDGLTFAGQLIAIGEDDDYLHCIISESGGYYGVLKSADENHLYQHLLKLN